MTSNSEPTSTMASAEAEGTMSAQLHELLIPPLACLAFTAVGLVLWTVVTRYKTKKTKILITSCDTADHPRSASSHSHHRHMPRDRATNRVSPDKDSYDGDSTTTDTTTISSLTSKATNNSNRISPEDEDTTPVLHFRPLFGSDDLHLIRTLQGEGTAYIMEVVRILMPVAGSLGFCPLTLLLHKPIVKFLWPPEIYEVTPNVNDAIACFLVPAGMVYAISFGFAFQQVASGFMEVQLGVQLQFSRLQKLVTLVNDLTALSTVTRAAMVKKVKDLTFTCLSQILGQDTGKRGDNAKALHDLNRILLTAKFKDVASIEDVDRWQRSLFQQLENLITQDDTLTSGVSNTHIHVLQWIFLETLGYFSFVGILLVQCSSYRADLTICLITVISISFLCYVVADLDSPFYGFFRIDLGCFRHLIEQLDHVFNRIVAGGMLEKSFVDFDVTVGS